MGTIRVSSYLKRYHEKQLRLFGKYLNKVNADLKKGDIHKLRTTEKKIKALYKLTEAITIEEFNGKKYFAPFKMLFKRAGDIRVIQVNRDNLLRYISKPDVTKGYNRLIKAEEKGADKVFFKSISKFNTKKLKKQRKEFNRFCKKIDNKKAIDNCHLLSLNEAKEIEKLKKQKQNIEVLHKIRKGLKNLAEVIKLLKEIQPVVSQKNLLKSLKQTETLIGNWHDKTILKESLKSYRLEFKPNKNENKEIKRVISLISRENKAILPVVNHKLDGTLNKCLRS